MKAALPSSTAGRVTAAVLGVLAAVLAAIAVVGGATTPSEPPPRTPAHPSMRTGKPTNGTSNTPRPETSCLLYDFECQAEGGSAVVPRQPSSAPDGTAPPHSPRR